MNANATKPTPAWRDVLPIHPACELFPPMSPDELRALGEERLGSTPRDRGGAPGTASALTLATILAMSPAAARSPTPIRKTFDELGKRLCRRVAEARPIPSYENF
jgi:hypothetical protein